jgi:phosphatidylinositol alpha-1,6-mannosyltransferase
MRLVLVAQDFPPTRGGIQSYCFELARNWALACERFVVLAPEVSGARNFDGDAPFDVHRLRATQNSFFIAAALALGRLGRSWVSFHSHWYSAGPALALRRGRATGPVFVAAHGRELLHEPWLRVRPAQAVYDRARRFALSRATCVFAVSQFTSELVSRSSRGRALVEVHPNGTDPTRFRPGARVELRRARGLELGASIFLCVARLVARKGIDTTLRAFQAVLAVNPEAQLLIVGEGPERVPCETLASTLGLGSRVRFLGALNQDELVCCYQLADVFVLPARSEGSDVEGFGIAYLEASACGLPCIGPNVGGPCDAIVHEQTGICVDPTSVAAVSDAMKRLAADPEARSRMGDRGRQRVLSELNWPGVAARIFRSIQLHSVRSQPATRPDPA